MIGVERVDGLEGRELDQGCRWPTGSLRRCHRLAQAGGFALDPGDHLRRLGREAFQPQAVFGIRTKITVALFPAGEKRGPAGDVDDQITT